MRVLEGKAETAMPKELQLVAAWWLFVLLYTLALLTLGARDRDEGRNVRAPKVGLGSGDATLDRGGDPEKLDVGESEVKLEGDMLRPVDDWGDLGLRERCR